MSAGAVALNALLLPFAVSMSLPQVPLAPSPYGGDGDRDLIQRADADVLPLSGGRTGYGVHYRATSSNHLSCEAFETYYRQPRPATVTRWLGIGARGDILREKGGTLEWLLGGAGINGARQAAGPRLGFSGALFPWKPLTLEVTGSATVPGAGTPVTEAAASLGAVFGPVAVRAGWKGLFGPLRPLAGPAFGLTAFF